MSDALVELVWGDGLNRFALHIGQLRELQDKCGVGPAAILSHLLEPAPKTEGKLIPRPEEYPAGARDPLFIDDLITFQTRRSLGYGWNIEHVRETIRLGLIGGGKTPSEAHALVSRYVDVDGGLFAGRPVAQQVLARALFGPPDDIVGKATAETAATPIQTEGSPSPPSTDGVLS